MLASCAILVTLVVAQCCGFVPRPTTPSPLNKQCDGATAVGVTAGGPHSNLTGNGDPPCSWIYCSTNDPNDRQHSMNGALNPDGSYKNLKGKWSWIYLCEQHFWTWVFTPEERASENWDKWQHLCQTTVPYVSDPEKYSNIASGVDFDNLFYPFMDTVDGEQVLYGWRVQLYDATKPGHLTGRYIYSSMLIPRLVGLEGAIPQNFSVKELELALCGAVVM